MEFLEQELQPHKTVQEAFAAHLSGVNLPVEVLYSGGMDSECVLVSCLQNKIPAIAITLRMMIDNSPFNVHDLYYSEKFCRENNIQQKIVDLHVDNFFENGDHIQYMEPYKIRGCGVPTHMWLMEQCSTFPIIGGDFTWPLVNIGRKEYSPHRHESAFYDVFMQNAGITGIGNMISHSMESNIFFIKEHIKVQEENPDLHGDNLKQLKIRHLKMKILNNLGFNDLELRHRSWGWEMPHHQKWFDVIGLYKELGLRWNPTKSIIKWNRALAEVVGGEVGSNDDYATVADGERIL